MTNYMNKIILTLLALALISLNSLSYANGYTENVKTVGDYAIHYNAFRSDSIPVVVAKQYNLPHASNRILINIAILKKVMHTMGMPTASKVEGFASNLANQYKKLNFREIKDGPSIYYLASIEVNDGETLKFNIKVTPEGEKHPIQLRFTKHFFIR